jgi:hypothetical protein
MDFTTAPEQAELWRRQYRPGREDPLSCMQVFLRNGEMRWSAAVLLGLDLGSNGEKKSQRQIPASWMRSSLPIERVLMQQYFCTCSESEVHVPT